MKEVKKPRFLFAGDDRVCGMTTTVRGKIGCDICEGRFKSSGVEVHLAVGRDIFTICPSCLRAGPASVAAESMRVAGDMGRVARMWGYDLTKDGDREDAANMAKIYHDFASALRRLHSFEESPGGKVALGIGEILRDSTGKRKGRVA